MPETTAFEAKFSARLNNVLFCADRVIFKGYLPLWGDACLNNFVDHALEIPRKDFIPHLEKFSQELVYHGKALAAREGAPYEYRQGRFKKEHYIDQVDRQRKHPNGLLAVLFVQEHCTTVKLCYAKGKPELKYD